MAPASAYLGSVDQQVGLCRLTLGQWDEAIVHFDDAAAIETAAGAHLAATQSRWYSATAGRRRGDAGADVLVAAAQDELRVCGVDRMLVAEVAGWS